MASSSDQFAGQMDDLVAQLSAVSKMAESGSEFLASNPGARITILKTLGKISSTIRQPQDEIMELFPQIAQMPVIRLFIKWKVFQMIPTEGSISYGEIASKLDADVNLISRLLRHHLFHVHFC